MKKLNKFDLDILSINAKFREDDNLNRKVCDFFWGIIGNSTQYKDDLIALAIEKYSSMIRDLSLEDFINLINQIKE